MKLDEKQKWVREKFEAQVARNPDKFVAEYRGKFDNYLCTDNALELCKEYRDGTKEEKAQYAPVVDETASKVVKAVYEQMLKEPAPKEKYNMVTFVTGGMASGKSTTIERVKEASHIVYEVVKGSDERIEKAFFSGKQVIIFHVYRPIEQATRSLISRSEKEGRTPSIEAFAEGHYLSQQFLFHHAQQYTDRKDFWVCVYDNSRFNNDGSRFSTIDLVRKNAYQSIDETKERAKGEFRYVRRERQERGNPIAGFVEERFFSKELARNSRGIREDNDRGLSREYSEGSRETQERRTLDRVEEAENQHQEQIKTTVEDCNQNYKKSTEHDQIITERSLQQVGEGSDRQFQPEHSKRQEKSKELEQESSAVVLAVREIPNENPVAYIQLTSGKIASFRIVDYKPGDDLYSINLSNDLIAELERSRRGETIKGDIKLQTIDREQQLQRSIQQHNLQIEQPTQDLERDRNR